MVATVWLVCSVAWLWGSHWIAGKYHPRHMNKFFVAGIGVPVVSFVVLLLIGSMKAK